MKKYIRLKTKQQFKEVVSDKWKGREFFWDAFKEETCDIPEEETFISLNRAKKLGYLESI